jgi:photosystem II protein
VKVLRAKSSDRGSAIFTFETPNTDASNILGMTMSDEEGDLVTREVRVKFADGKFKSLEAIYEIETATDWERFLRFMERFSQENEMGLDR